MCAFAIGVFTGIHCSPPGRFGAVMVGPSAVPQVMHLFPGITLLDRSDRPRINGHRYATIDTTIVSQCAILPRPVIRPRRPDQPSSRVRISRRLPRSPHGGTVTNCRRPAPPERHRPPTPLHSPRSSAAATKPPPAAESENLVVRRHAARDAGRRQPFIPTRRRIDSPVDGRRAGIVLISQAAAPPTPRARSPLPCSRHPMALPAPPHPGVG
jgi:hypothetical protein